jgi:acid stress-induced BolA-like protein IbaG/YrbA
MSLQILGDDSAETIEHIRSAIEAAVPCQELDVRAGSPRHYSIRVVSNAFAGLSRVKQQQLVYAAISNLMAGDSAPLHAVDHLECVSPGAA